MALLHGQIVARIMPGNLQEPGEIGRAKLICPESPLPPLFRDYSVFTLSRIERASDIVVGNWYQRSALTWISTNKLHQEE